MGDDYLDVTGTAQSASCSIMDDKNQRSVDTQIPNKIPLHTGMFSVVNLNCQKSGTAGTLRLRIMVNGDVKASGQTSAQYGIVQLTYPH